MTTKQKVLNICESNKIDIDVSIGVGRNIDLLAPNGFRFQGGTHCICSPTHYTNQNEVWKGLLDRLNEELPLTKCNCEDCNELLTA